MNKKSIVILLVLVLSISGLFAKDLGIKVGGQLGWGFDILTIKKILEDDFEVAKSKNNGFAFNLTGEYDFDENWGVKANFGMMFAGLTTWGNQKNKEDTYKEQTLKERAGLYIDFALDAKYTYAINQKVSIAGLAGLELVSGYLAKGTTGDVTASNLYYNVAFGLNLGVEGSYKITDKISVAGGVSGAWFFVNSAKLFEKVKEDDSSILKVSVASFYIRPYVGATYSF